MSYIFKLSSIKGSHVIVLVYVCLLANYLTNQWTNFKETQKIISGQLNTFWSQLNLRWPPQMNNHSKRKKKMSPTLSVLQTLS